jgi:hypothetical protein
MSTSKCDIIRDVATAASCGMCTALAATPPRPIPEGCAAAGRVPPAAACGVPVAANTRMKLFDERYSPAGLFGSATDKKARALIEKDYVTAIDRAEKGLAAAYPAAPAAATDIRWPDFQGCLWNRSGQRGGPNNNVYFGRGDLTQLGMMPVYPLGGGFAQNSIWKAGKAPSPVPVKVDYLMNPDLFTIVVLVFLVIVFAALMRAAWRHARGAPLRALLAEEAARAALPADTRPPPSRLYQQYAWIKGNKDFNVQAYKELFDAGLKDWYRGRKGAGRVPAPK